MAKKIVILIDGLERPIYLTTIAGLFSVIAFNPTGGG
jgi:hypothetical protein